MIFKLTEAVKSAQMFSPQHDPALDEAITCLEASISGDSSAKQTDEPLSKTKSEDSGRLPTENEGDLNEHESLNRKKTAESSEIAEGGAGANQFPKSMNNSNHSADNSTDAPATNEDPTARSAQESQPNSRGILPSCEQARSGEDESPNMKSNCNSSDNSDEAEPGAEGNKNIEAELENRNTPDKDKAQREMSNPSGGDVVSDETLNMDTKL